MVDLSKITPAHRQRLAIVYVRQSSPGQVQRNPESTARQYEFVTRALELGWQRHQVVVIDEDQGTSANGIAVRSGFGHLTAEVALGHVGIILGLELSRLARNNADWYRLLDLCGITNALLADDDGLYHPGDFNDRLVLGLKSTMSEAELHVLRSRLDGGIRHKAARGELRRGLPVGLVWGEQDGEVRLHPDEAITGAIRTVFDASASSARLAGCGCGSAPKSWTSRSRCRGSRASAGSYPPTPPSTTCSPTPCTLAHMCTGRPALNASWMPVGASASGPAIYPEPNGQCSCRTTTQASSRGRSI